jgi:hypothetical protein
MHSFMFISSYENLRQLIRTSAQIENVLHLGPRLFDVGNPGTLQTVAFTLFQPAGTINTDVHATYFRLVKAPSAEAKRLGFEQALAQLRSQRSERSERSDRSNVFTYRQADFDAIPGSPWVYWVTPELRNLFIDRPKLGDIAPPRVGLQTGVNARFLRLWWEVGLRFISRDRTDGNDALANGYGWFPYMKGGFSFRWFGNQEHVVNWRHGGSELFAFTPTSVIRNQAFYFRRGVTYSYLTQVTFSARLSPGGFIFDVAGSSLFPPDDRLPLVLAILNSSFAAYALRLINPTVNFQVGDLARLPIPDHSSLRLDAMVEQAIALARQDSAESETTYDFLAPPAWPDGLDAVAARHAELDRIEREIDDEVYRLYGISAEDRAAIEVELAAPSAANGDGEAEDASAEPGDDADPEPAPVDRTALAQAWVSYAVGVALGRFVPSPAGGGGLGWGGVRARCSRGAARPGRRRRDHRDRARPPR